MRELALHDSVRPRGASFACGDGHRFDIGEAHQQGSVLFVRPSCAESFLGASMAPAYGQSGRCARIGDSGRPGEQPRWCATPAGKRGDRGGRGRQRRQSRPRRENSLGIQRHGGRSGLQLRRNPVDGAKRCIVDWSMRMLTTSPTFGSSRGVTRMAVSLFWSPMRLDAAVLAAPPVRTSP